MNHPQYETTRHLFDWHNRLGLAAFAVLLAIALFGFGAML